MSSSHRNILSITALTVVLAPLAALAGQSSVAVSPFVSYVPSAATNPLVGMALTFGGTTGLALRGSADISVANPEQIASSGGTGTTTTAGPRPWGADADAMLFLGGLGGGATVFSRALAPYVFSGIGLTGGDSAGSNVVRNGWSYGAGAAIPLGLDADLFGEARWRMSAYVLPTSKNAPSSRSEMRFGLSFHVGGGSREPAPVPDRRGGRRSRQESYGVYDDYGRRDRMDVYDDEAVYEPVRTVPDVATTPNATTTTATQTTITMRGPGSILRRSRSGISRARQTTAQTQTRARTSTRTATRTQTARTQIQREVVRRSRRP